MNGLRQIIEQGACIGCGVCAAASEGGVPVHLTAEGFYQADAERASSLPSGLLQQALSVCPFSGIGPDEDELALRLYGSAKAWDGRIGRYDGLYAGHVVEEDFRAKGSSGGLLSWLLAELLRTGRVDAVAHVRPVDNPADGVLFRYALSRTEAEVRAGAKSRYYPVELSGVLDEMARVPGRYAVVGLPCFIKAVRRLAESHPVFNERIVFCIGLVCGHLKSKAFADCFGWLAGIAPGQLEAIDFRVKLPGRTASDYGVYLRGAGREQLKPAREFIGSDWGHNFFRYPACNWCDDVFAETADVAVGDAWLRQYNRDPRGTSVAVVRHVALHDLIRRARAEGRLDLTEASAETLAASQAGGLRDRREGLAYRLHLRRQAGEWVPKKRVTPCARIPGSRQRLYRIRQQLEMESRRAWQLAVQSGRLDLFEREAARLGALYRKSRPLSPRRLPSAVRRIFNAPSFLKPHL